MIMHVITQNQLLYDSSLAHTYILCSYEFWVCLVCLFIPFAIMQFFCRNFKEYLFSQHDVSIIWDSVFCIISMIIILYAIKCRISALVCMFDTKFICTFKVVNIKEICHLIIFLQSKFAIGILTSLMPCLFMLVSCCL